MDKIEKIRQEIERRMKIYKESNYGISLRYQELEELLTFLDTLSEEPDKSLEEEISRTYHDGSVTDTEDIDHVAYENIAHHFAEWQAEKCDEETSKLLYAERQTAYINGWDDHKEQMLKDAVESNVVITGKGILLSDLRIEYFNYEDKVRIVVLKAEEE